MKPAIAMSLLLAASTGCATQMSEDGDFVDGKADGRECANGRSDSADFPGEGQRTSIVEAANNTRLSDLRIFIDEDAVANLADARRDKPFTSIVEVACVPGIGKAALKELDLFSLSTCGGFRHESIASSRATARQCFSWSGACDSDNAITGEPFPECKADFFVERYVRDRGDGVDPFPSLPTEITLSADGYELVDGAGEREFGTYRPFEKNHPDGLWSYFRLMPDETKDDHKTWRNLQYEFSADGEELVLTPISGPIGVDAEPPVYRFESDQLPFCDDLGGECRPEPPTGDSGPCFADEEVDALGCGSSGLFACCVAND